MAALVWITCASLAAAHEVLPTIGDMELVDGQITFSLEGNFESIVAGIDLDGLEDTEAAPEAEIYDALRAMDPDAFAARVDGYWPDMARAIDVIVDGERVALEFTGIDVPQVGDVDVVRQSKLTFVGAVPDTAQSVQIGWPAEYGVLVLRQMGVEGGWDGYLSGGGLTDPVALGGGTEMTGLDGFLRYIPVGSGPVPVGRQNAAVVVASVRVHAGAYDYLGAGRIGICHCSCIHR
jgi:hypothetical protein